MEMGALKADFSPQHSKCQVSHDSTVTGPSADISPLWEGARRLPRPLICPWRPWIGASAPLPAHPDVDADLQTPMVTW